MCKPTYCLAYTKLEMHSTRKPSPAVEELDIELKSKAGKSMRLHGFALKNSGYHLTLQVTNKVCFFDFTVTKYHLT